MNERWTPPIRPPGRPLVRPGPEPPVRTHAVDPRWALAAIDLGYGPLRIPADVAELLADAERRVVQCRQELGRSAVEFVACNATVVYHALTTIVERQWAVGPAFCEWGSGLGVVAALAAKAGFHACGIEIAPELVERSRLFLRDHAVDVTIHQGSFKPEGLYEQRVVDGADWSGPPQFAPARFDVIYAYPWPAEERVIFELFGRFASPGALLVTYYGGRDLRVHRRT